VRAFVCTRMRMHTRPTPLSLACPLSHHRGRGRGRGRGSTPRASSLLYRSGADDRTGKRRRRDEFDVGDVVVPIALAAPKYVERAVPKNIDTPRVRTLGAEELERRTAAVEAFAAKAKKDGAWGCGMRAGGGWG
jgi:hypothetical protein